MKDINLNDEKDAPATLASWRRFLANRPKVDMDRCKNGTKMLTNKGRIAIYIRKTADDFPHSIKFEDDSSYGTRTNEGWVYAKTPLPGDEDIVYIFP